MNCSWTKPNANDQQCIRLQLGREPRGLLGVACRCRHGFPQVIVNRPLHLSGEELQVFPTVYWLSCPYVNAQIAKLESGGAIGRLQEMLAGNETMERALNLAHSQYAQARMALVPDDAARRLQKQYPRRYRVLRDSGIGGIRSKTGLKCLHTHGAHSLAGGENPIGRWVLDQIHDYEGCPTGRCQEELQAYAGSH